MDTHSLHYLPTDAHALRTKSFQLVSTDATGFVQRLPAELGPLPLYRDDDGFYSVIGPSLSHTTPGEDQTNESANSTLAYDRINISATLRPPREKVFCGSSRCSGNSGPHTCTRQSYTCNAPDCTPWDPFKTKQALNRHYEEIHLGERFDCPVSGCENVGEKGIKRLDNLVAHMKNKHGALPAGGSCGNWLIPRATV
ncbi:hypothetical protein HOY82DRAFT_600339 [Tuber indicum]|nr:hypothetical protein HOY82DRAFT_600339 [Tuber indicum]